MAVSSHSLGRPETCFFPMIFNGYCKIDYDCILYIIVYRRFEFKHNYYVEANFLAEELGTNQVPIYHPDHRPRPWPRRLGPEQYAHGMGHRLLRAFWSSQRGCERAMGQLCWRGAGVCVVDFLFPCIYIWWLRTCTRGGDKEGKFGSLSSGFMWRQCSLNFQTGHGTSSKYTPGRKFSILCLCTANVKQVMYPVPGWKSSRCWRLEIFNAEHIRYQ